MQSVYGTVWLNLRCHLLVQIYSTYYVLVHGTAASESVRVQLPCMAYTRSGLQSGAARPGRVSLCVWSSGPGDKHPDGYTYTYTTRG